MATSCIRYSGRKAAACWRKRGYLQLGLSWYGGRYDHAAVEAFGKSKRGVAPIKGTEMRYVARQEACRVEGQGQGQGQGLGLVGIEHLLRMIRFQFCNEELRFCGTTKSVAQMVTLFVLLIFR